MDTVRVYQDESGHWRWTKVAPNERRIATSGESFDSKANAIRSAEAEAADTDAEVVVEDS